MGLPIKPRDPNRPRLPLAKRLKLRRLLTSLACGFLHEQPRHRHHTDPFRHIDHKAQRDAALLAYLHTLPVDDVVFMAQCKTFIKQEIG